jgi:hypothetical protein
MKLVGWYLAMIRSKSSPGASHRQPRFRTTMKLFLEDQALVTWGLSGGQGEWKSSLGTQWTWVLEQFCLPLKGRGGPMDI